MLSMAEKEKKRGRGRPKSPASDKEVQFQTRMTQQLRDAIDRYRESLEFPPQLTDIGVKAFEEFLAARGFWPPKGT